MPDFSVTTIDVLSKAGNLDFGDGYRTKRSEHGLPGLPILRVAEVLQGKIVPEFTDFVSVSYRPSIGPKASRSGDVVLTTKGTVGRVAMIPPDFPEFVYSPQVCYFRINPNSSIRRRYLYYWLKGQEFWNQANHLKGQTDMADYLSLSDIRALKISLPSLRIQEGISAVLGALDDKISVNDRIAATYEELFKARFEALQIDVDSGDIPSSELVEFNPKLRMPRHTGTVYLDMAALATDSATVSGWTRREPKSGTRFANGDTVMARITPCLENGKTAFIDFMEDGEVGVGSTEFIVMRARPGVPTHVPYFLARSPRFRANAIRNMVGSSGRQRVSAAQISEFPLMRPDNGKLAKFGEDAQAAFDHIRSLANESRMLAELRDTLLPKLMSGEIRVREAEKAVEEVV